MCEPGSEAGVRSLITYQREVTYSLLSGACSGFAGRVCRMLLQTDLRPAGNAECLPWADMSAGRFAGSVRPCSKQTGCVYRQREEDPVSASQPLFLCFALRGGGLPRQALLRVPRGGGQADGPDPSNLSTDALRRGRPGGRGQPQLS